MKLSTNPAVAGANIASSSMEQMKAVIEALRQDVPVEDMAVMQRGQRIPLQEYLLGVRSVSPLETFFNGAPVFDIYVTLPFGLKNCPNKIGVFPFEVHNLLERFDAYIWSETRNFNPEDIDDPNGVSPVWANFMSAYKHAESTREGTLLIWENPHLSSSLDRIASMRIAFSPCPTYASLVETAGKARQNKEQYERTPQESLLAWIHKKGREEQRSRARVLPNMHKELTQIAETAVEQLKSLGHEYRAIFLKCDGSVPEDYQI